MVRESYLKKDGTFQTNKSKLKLIFKDIAKTNINQLGAYDDINNVYFKFIKLDNQDFICFADN